MGFEFQLDTEGRQETLDYLQRNVAASQEEADAAVEKGWFSGGGGELMSGLAHAGRSVAITGGAIPAAIDWAIGDDNLSGESLADQYFELVDEPTRAAVEYWKPDPAMASRSGRIVGALGAGIAQLIAAGGNPALLAIDQQIGTATDLVDQGVDSTTAQMVGGAQGLATVAGFRLGTYGASLLAKAGSGAAGNLLTNTPAAAASQSVLEAGGYDEQAKQFNPWDVEARAIDILMGAAFGAVAHFGPKPADTPTTTEDAPQANLLPSEQADLLAANGAKNWAVNVAPGIPDTAADAAKHHNAMSTALEQVMRNEPVNIAEHIDGANFRPKAGQGPDLLGYMREEYGADFDAKPVRPMDSDEQASIVTPETTRAAPEVKPEAPEEPEVIAARQALERPGSREIPMGDDDSPGYVDAKKAWDQADAEVATAKHEGKAYMAAITCLLGG